MTSIYTIEIPKTDPCEQWHTLAYFDSEEKAIAFSDEKLGTNQGWYCMISYDGEWWVCDTPSPNLGNKNNQFLEIEAFKHKEDCLDFIKANFLMARPDGSIYLIFCNIQEIQSDAGAVLGSPQVERPASRSDDN